MAVAVTRQQPRLSRAMKRRLGSMGLLLVGLGSLLGVYLVYVRLSVGSLSPNAAIFDAFCLIMGMQMLFFAMWMDMEHNKGLR